MNIDISKYFKLDELEPEDRAAFVNSIINLVLAKMADLIGDHLTEEELSELEALSSNGADEGVINWLNDHIPSFSAGVDEAMADIALDLQSKVDATLKVIPLDEEQ